MAEDIYRLNALALPVQEGSRTTRREEAAAEVTRLIDQQVFVAGGPDTVVRQLRFAHQALGFDLFLAHVYAAGIDQERVRRTMHLLATDVAPQLTVAV